MLFQDRTGKISTIKNNQLLRYILCGACTTAINVAVFYLLRIVLLLPLFLSNFISIAAAILFAFFVNKIIVFDTGRKNRPGVTREFLLFLGMRLVSMAVEIAGIWCAVAVLFIPDFYGKLLLQIVVIAFNFLFSKYVVFRKDRAGGPVQRQERESWKMQKFRS